MLSQVRSTEKTKSNTEHLLHIPSSAASTPAAETMTATLTTTIVQ
jgi:hypothetical protein